jgi:hypothetical protein
LFVCIRDRRERGLRAEFWMTDVFKGVSIFVLKVWIICGRFRGKEILEIVNKVILVFYRSLWTRMWPWRGLIKII